MKINYNQTGANRKEMVRIISEAIGTPKQYAGTPTYAFHIGAFTVTRYGVLEFDSAATDDKQIKTVINALKAAGFDYEGSESLSIGFPLAGFTEEGIASLEKLVASKAALIKKALGVEELPIERGETELTFPWFRAGLEREETYAFAQFITQLCKTAKAKKRVTAKAHESFENEKFAMRVWLIGLGMIGEEFKTARKLMMQNLSGNGAWRYGAPGREEASVTEAGATTEATPNHAAIAPNMAADGVHEADAKGVA